MFEDLDGKPQKKVKKATDDVNLNSFYLNSKWIYIIFYLKTKLKK